jgi:DNA repair protein RecN (Recombination protein N)
MLRELHISNLAVIADARIELDAGLNCFTGSTGAGKSLVIGALQVLLGLRSAAEMLRPGVDEARISGVFEIGDNSRLLAEVERITDVAVNADGGDLLLTRRLYASGRSSITLNGNPITLGMLKQLAEALVDVHGQHDHQYLLKPSNQVDVLDQFAGLYPLRAKYRDVFDRLQEARHRLQELSASSSLRQQQLELYRFQVDEIEHVQLDTAEHAELEGRSSVLRNLEKLKKDTGAVHAALYEADGSVLERLKMMAAVLAELANLDPQLTDVAGSVKDATISLEESAFDLSRYLGKLDLDPSELAEIDDRLNTINRILNKYGGTMSDTLAHRAELGERIAELERATVDLSSIQEELAPLTKEGEALAKELRAKRQAAAKKLAPLIEKELAELGMDKARFTIDFAEADMGPSGCDEVEFIAQTNPGLSPQPLRKIASGGELSRIMLALKGILAHSDRISVLVFDEIDANVGGRLGSVIGEKLRGLAAADHQVLCITHLPQIASYADRHLTVRKSTNGQQTETSVRIVQGQERLEELAEMIGGPRITDTTRAQARELIEAAKDQAAAATTKARKNGKMVKSR